MTDFLRTPEDRFADLPDFPYEPHYVDVLGGRMHYVDTGTGEEVILCLHGEPTWSFLYRKMIAPLAQRFRVIAPDMLGFGRSDKPAQIDDHTYDLHHRSLTAFIEALDLQRITLVCQDWGGLLGLPIATEQPERFSRLVIMNTGLPTGERPPTEGFKRWLAFAKQVGRDLEPGQLVALSAAGDKPAPEVLAAYDAPFPDARYRAGVAALPLLVPTAPEMPGAAQIRAARDRLRTWQKPALVMFSDSDPVTSGGGRAFRRLIPSASQSPEIVIHGAGHFLQEEKGEEIAQHILNWIPQTG